MNKNINRPYGTGGDQPAAKARILVHVAHGPESATRAALAFLVARTALEKGHSVSVFLAGDAVQLVRDATLAASPASAPDGCANTSKPSSKAVGNSTCRACRARPAA